MLLVQLAVAVQAQPVVARALASDCASSSGTELASSYWPTTAQLGSPQPGRPQRAAETMEPRWPRQPDCSRNLRCWDDLHRTESTSRHARTDPRHHNLPVVPCR